MLDISENNLINGLKLLSIGKNEYKSKSTCEEASIKNKSKKSENVETIANQDFGVIIFDDEEDSKNCEPLDENCNNLVPRGPAKQSTKQRAVPYCTNKNMGNSLDLKVNCQKNYSAQLGYLTPPRSNQLSPARQIIHFTEYNFHSDALTPESIPVSSPEFSSDLINETNNCSQPLKDLGYIIQECEDNVDSGISSSSMSKQSSESDLGTDILCGIQTLEGIENADFVLNILKKLEDELKAEDDSSNHSQIVSTKNIERMNNAYIAVAKMKFEDLVKTDSDGDCCLIVAAAKNQTFLVKALVERMQRENLVHQIINQQNKNGVTALYCAVMDNNYHLVGYLVKNHANVNINYYTKRMDKNNSLMFRLVHYLAEKGVAYLETLKQLLSSDNIEIDCYNSRGCTPLLCAIEKHNNEQIDSCETIKLLVKKGSDLMMQNRQSYKPPLQIAIEKKSPEIVKLLLKLASEIDSNNELAYKQQFNDNNLNIRNEFTADKNIKNGLQNMSSKILDAPFMKNLVNVANHFPIIENQQYWQDMNGNYSYENCVDNQTEVYTQSYDQLSSFQPGTLHLQSHPEDVFYSTNQNACLANGFKGSAYARSDNIQFENLPIQIQHHNSTWLAPNIGYLSIKKQPLLIEQMLCFRNKGQADFSMLGCAYDMCVVCGMEERAKDVVKILLSQGATIAPKSKANPISCLPEFLVYQKKKK